MARTIVSTIRKAPSPDGPYWVQSRDTTATDGADSNITLGLANVSAALDQAKSDQAALLSGGSVVQSVISSIVDP